jgi:NAD(P)-dependent dehydrogenase (short-subunit alcohol dehydrogenase family)
MQFSPEVVVITGASAGVGRAVARAYAARGARIGLLARGRDGLDAAQREVEAAGGRGLAVQTDVAHADEVEAAAGAVEAQFGPIDTWINNAMLSVFWPIKAMPPMSFAA